jgi:hypothetical protein
MQFSCPRACGTKPKPSRYGGMANLGFGNNLYVPTSEILGHACISQQGRKTYRSAVAAYAW